MKNFPNLEKVVTTDKLATRLQYAVVLNGKIIATDSHVLSIIDLKLYIKDPENLKNIEGKIFDAKLLKRLAKADKIEFLTDKIILTEKKNISQVFYPGEISENREMFYRDEKTGEKLCGSFGFYPNIYAVIPEYDQTTGKINLSKYKRKTTAFNITKLSNIVAGFRNENHFIISDEKNRPSIVLPVPKEGEENIFAEIGLIMPVICPGLDLTIFDLKPEKIETAKSEIEAIEINQATEPEPAPEPPAKIEAAPAKIVLKRAPANRLKSEKKPAKNYAEISKKAIEASEPKKRRSFKMKLRTYLK